MNGEEEKEYIEAEIVSDKNNIEKKNKANKNNGNFSEIKSLLWKGILVVLIFCFLFFGLIFLIFPSPYDYIISAVIVFFIIRGLLNIFNIKK